MGRPSWSASWSLMELIAGAGGHELTSRRPRRRLSTSVRRVALTGGSNRRRGPRSRPVNWADSEVRLEDEASASARPDGGRESAPESRYRVTTCLGRPEAPIDGSGAAGLPSSRVHGQRRKL